MSKIKFDYKVAEDVAIQEVKDLVDEYAAKEQTIKEIQDNWPRLITAVRTGNIVINPEATITLTLREPLTSENGSPVLNEITFKNRITLSERKKITAGLDVNRDNLEIGARCMAYLTGQPVAFLDKFGRWDYKVIEEVYQLFL